MKKAVALLLVLCVCISLYACGDNSEKSAQSTVPAKSIEAQKADELILAIGDVSLERESAILAAKAYYDTLTEEQKTEVENYAVLETAISNLAEMENEAIYNEALSLEKEDPEKAMELYRSLPETYKDVTARIQALEKKTYRIEIFSDCSIIFEINGVLALAKEHTIELKAGEDVAVTVVPICSKCEAEQAPVSITIPAGEFDERSIVQKLAYSPCNNRNCNTLTFLYGINVYKETEATESAQETATEPALSAPEDPANVTGKKYLCTKVQFTDEEYDEFDVADSVRNKLFRSTVVISEDRSILVYTNQMGVYIADLVTEYDGEMWYESDVTWREIPTPYGEHKVTATELIFDEARGLVRMNFSLDGEEGNSWSGRYFIFNEFEIE